MGEKRLNGGSAPDNGAPLALSLRSCEVLREHPCANLVPELSQAEYKSLLAGIRQHGLLTPLHVTSEGVVLDGRHRLRAARELGLSRVPVLVVAPANEVEQILLGSLQRRQLSQSQKACLAVELDAYRSARAAGEQRKRANLQHKQEVAALPPRGRSRDLAAKEAGVSPRLVQDAATLQRTAPDLFEQVKTGGLPLHRARQELKRQQRYAQIGPTPPLPEGSFDLIYADPPWQLGNPDSPFAPEQHYPTQPLEEIKRLAIPAAADAGLFLWIPNGLLPAGLEVMSAWGFDYRSNLAWVKNGIGPGHWLRNRHELLLIGRRGTFPPPQPEDRVDSVIQAARSGHSSKPERVYQLLEQMYPQARRLELYARGQPRPGWTTWGNQAEQAA
jgi:N6-adenosine-specific RNA methylase IME4